MADRKTRLPAGLEKLPTLTFYRSPAPSGAARSRPDTVYDVHSTKTLVNEFRKREAQIRGLK